MALRSPIPHGDDGDAAAAAKRLVWNAWSAGGVVPEPMAFADDVEFHGPAPIGVAVTGSIVGRMTGSWLGIGPSDAPTTVRFGEFHRVVDDQVVEIRCLFDVLAVATRAGSRLLPPVQRPDIPPGPADGHGLCVGFQPPAETALTLQLVNDMLDGCNRLTGGVLSSMGMDRLHRPMRRRPAGRPTTPPRSWEPT